MSQTITAPAPVSASQAVSFRVSFGYGFTIFVGAFLLFQVQLILGKYILPWFGGSPSTWTTCLLFFQMLLLAGYGYSHLLSTRLSPPAQPRFHIIFLAFSVAVVILGAILWRTPLLPGGSWKPASSEHPVIHILGLLLVASGLPYLLLSTTAPLLQHWYSQTHAGRSPYRFYALSNAGSLLGLLTYPFVFEPQLPLHAHAWIWFAAYLAFVGGAAFCAWDTRGKAFSAPHKEERADSSSAPTKTVQVLWFLLPTAASVMLLATTNLMCQQIAVVPLLWVLPLALYLLSFIICFDNPRWYRREIFHALLGAGLPLAALTLVTESSAPIIRQIWMLSLILFGCCMVCHGELVRLRPAPRYLTRFYLLVSAGGAAGGLFVALMAPNIFKGFWEFHIGLIACVVLGIVALVRDRNSWWFQPKPYVGVAILIGLFTTPELFARMTYLLDAPRVLYEYHYYQILGFLFLLLFISLFSSLRKPRRPRRFNTAQFASIVVVTALCVGLAYNIKMETIHGPRRDRNFYGVLTIHEADGVRSLFHGMILHGRQSLSNPKEPSGYFAPGSGIGELLSETLVCAPPCSRRIGIIGMGVGTLAAYGRPGDTVRFYEINPQVIDYSEGSHPYFTYLRDAAAKIEVVEGDGRLALERELATSGPQRFDVLVMDAFSGDAVPVHLLTREAFALYLEHLRGQSSVLAVHITNKMLDLAPIMVAQARENHLYLVRAHRRASNGSESDWVFFSRDPQVLSGLRSKASPLPERAVLWTDDYSNLFRVLR